MHLLNLLRRTGSPRHLRRALIALLFWISAACGGAEPDVESVRVDTVGTRVVVESPSVEPERATLIRRIGAADATGGETPDLFGRIRSVTLDDEGSIYVADNQAQEVRVFSSEGIHLRTFGRPGEGPGELGDLYSLGWLGDTLAAMDPGNARITREGTLVVERIHLGATRFDFFTSEGLLEQRVDLPERDDGVAPVFVDRWIVMVERGELGVQTVGLYER